MSEELKAREIKLEGAAGILFSELDLNGDGVLSLEEVIAGAGKLTSFVAAAKQGIQLD